MTGATTPVGPFCPPIDGAWRPQNGITLPSEADCGPMGRRPYDDACAARARWCELNGIPTGVAIPLEVADLVSKAIVFRAYPHRAAPLWERARALLAQAALQEAT
jgi:hypothetical protein